MFGERCYYKHDISGNCGTFYLCIDTVNMHLQ